MEKWKILLTYVSAKKRLAERAMKGHEEMKNEAGIKYWQGQRDSYEDVVEWAEKVLNEFTSA